MTLFLLIIVLISLCRIKAAKPILSGINSNYLDVNRTNSIKGIFILLVFLSHARNDISMFPEYSENALNGIYNIFQNHLGQGVVVMFLFYSGYGVMESIKRKGVPYINAIPKNRFAKTLLNFDIAVLVFLILSLCLGTLKNYTIPHVLLSFIGWESVGNSNWYIFAILILYLLTYISFKIFKNKFSYAAAFTTAFTVVYIITLSFFKDAWWFDTVILYPLGIWYSIGKEKIEGFIKKKSINYFFLLIMSFAIFVVTHLLRGNILCYEISQVALCAVIVFVTMKFDINNKVINFFGRHLFEIYILMRIPMNLLIHFGITDTYPFVLISLATTIVLAVLFKKLLSFIDSKIFAKG